ncbi:PREDICTED: transmembrane protein 230-like [Hipposideros armiger]|uniref:Transmembrane protein 230 n=1 Tax=Hipposideros armiger TaxID=186990 RepID=A0A8B7TFE8_HIPAR|nr:PREDICTED: transmembrane protein 230-like [Hipposideros armiger]
MVPTRTNVATEIPSSKVKVSMLPSTGGGHINRQKKTKSPKIPYKAIACATVQFSIGAFLILLGCFLLAGYISKIGSSRAVAVLIVGLLVFLPVFYHLLIACRAQRGCQGYSYQDLTDCDD